MIDVVFQVEIESSNTSFPEWAKVFSKLLKMPALLPKGSTIWFSLNCPEVEGCYGACTINDIAYYEDPGVFLVHTISSGSASFEWDENGCTLAWIENGWSACEGTEIHPLSNS